MASWLLVRQISPARYRAKQLCITTGQLLVPTFMFKKKKSGGLKRDGGYQEEWVPWPQRHCREGNIIYLIRILNIMRISHINSTIFGGAE